MTDDTGMAGMELRCPNRHLVGRIIKYSVGSSLLLDMPKRLREDWKQVSERPMLTTHCGVCKRAVSKATDTVTRECRRLSSINHAARVYRWPCSLEVRVAARSPGGD